MGSTQYAVGVDIGGTNMVAAVVNTHQGRVQSQATIPTRSEQGYEDGFHRLGNLINQVCDEAQISAHDLIGIGVGCTSPIDSVRGTINNPYTLPGWEDAPLLPYLSDRFQIPNILLNDAAAAALGEYWNGAGRGTQHMIYITVGTGIGAGIILEGRLHRGVGLLAGEVGHQVIDVNGPECYCGARGCLEALAAGPAITRFAAERVSPGSLMLRLAEGNPQSITPKIIYEAARGDDGIALQILHQTGVYLGVGIANLLNVLAPQMVVLGGGIMQGWDLIAPSMLKTISERDAMIPFHQIRIVPAELGLSAGVTGSVKGLLDHFDGRL